MATYGIFGWIFTIYRAITSMIIAIVAGILTNIFDKDEEIKKPAFSAVAPQSNTFSINTPIEKESCCSSNSCCDSTTGTKKFSFIAAMKYACYP